jgi:multidrug efflux pump
MKALLASCLAKSRLVLTCLVFSWLAGWVAYCHMPREATPDIDLPVFYVGVALEGASPEDAERLLLRPLERELQNIAGVREMSSKALEGYAWVTLEFDASFNKSKAFQDIRQKVDTARADFPKDAQVPTIEEQSFALFPVLLVSLSGDLPQERLMGLAKDLKRGIEGLPQVLKVDIDGYRKDQVEVTLHPFTLRHYWLGFGALQEFKGWVSRYNHLISAGAIDQGNGTLTLKVPGVYAELQDLLHTPVQAQPGQSVLRFADIATAQRGLQDASSSARMNGKPTLGLYITKRPGANIIQTTQAIRDLVATYQTRWPQGVRVDYSQDSSEEIRVMLTDLQNSLIVAVILVMAIIIWALGWRSAGLVGLAIPGSFLMGILCLYALGVTINNVVLFSLILAVGMLVDGAIIVVEYADRRMSQGVPRAQAYYEAACRMMGPVVSSIAATLAAFLPLLFWPGVIGKFMRYLPITLLATLLASLLMALVFVPTLGALVGKPKTQHDADWVTAETGDLLRLGGIVGAYIRGLYPFLQRPLATVGWGCLCLVAVYVAYGAWGHGLIFWPRTEPERLIVNVRMRGDLSLRQIEALAQEAEAAILQTPGIATCYAKMTTLPSGGSGSVAEDTHAVFQLELKEWLHRPKAAAIVAQLEAQFKKIPGMIIEVNADQGGSSGASKPIKIHLYSHWPDQLEPALETVLAKMRSLPGFKAIADSRPAPAIEWQVKIDRSKAAFLGTQPDAVGEALQLLTIGYKLTHYRPYDAEEQVDIVLRYPEAQRHWDALQWMQVPTPRGWVPLTALAQVLPQQKVSSIKRSAGQRVYKIGADLEPGYLADSQIRLLRDWLKNEHPIDSRVTVKFKGDYQNQEESQAFLVKAFWGALGLIFLILLAQFNSFYHSFLILTAIVFSTAGVLLGLLVTREPFGVLMTGIGVIALAGVVVNHNIVLIDTYRHLRSAGQPATEAVLRASAQRFRPVMLTTITVILGILPLAFQVTVDLITPGVPWVTVGAPATLWWQPLAVAMVSGLLFAKLITLVLTPALLVVGERLPRFAAPRITPEPDGPTANGS